MNVTLRYTEVGLAKPVPMSRCELTPEGAKAASSDDLSLNTFKLSISRPESEIPPASDAEVIHPAGTSLKPASDARFLKLASRRTTLIKEPRN